MKEKIFYVVNLDKKRIAFLLVFLAGLLSSFFFLGVSVGKGNTMVQLHKSQMVQSSQPITQPQPNIEKEKTLDSKELAEEGSSSSETESITLANKAPQLDQNPSEPKWVSLSTEPMSENVEKVESLHAAEPLPSKSILPKHTPKKPIPSEFHESQGKYTIQLAAFSSREDAEKLVKKILADNPQLKTKPYIRPSGKYFSVRIGRSNDKNRLKNLLDSLHLPNNLRKSAYIVNYS